MSLQIASLNSGSNGNCYYIANEQEAVLVDVGISCREVEKRMKRLNLPMQKVKAVFISHEHIDHISGVRVLSKKHRLPVYINQGTLNNSRLQLEKDLVRNFGQGTIEVGNLKVSPFAKYHDAADPYSFMVEGNNVKIAVITDVGIACERVVHHFRQCHAAFLEANYDEHMLENGGYPFYLKSRIRGGHGHLSNRQALELFLNYKAPHLSHLILSHLSKNNNTPELVEELFAKHTGQVNVVVASRYQETDVYTIHGNAIGAETMQRRKSVLTGKQLPLFFSETSSEENKGKN